MPSRPVLMHLLLAAAVVTFGSSVLPAGSLCEICLASRVAGAMEVGFQKGNSDNAVVKVYVKGKEDPTKVQPPPERILRPKDSREGKARTRVELDSDLEYELVFVGFATYCKAKLYALQKTPGGKVQVRMDFTASANIASPEVDLKDRKIEPRNSTAHAVVLAGEQHKTATILFIP